MPLFVMAGMTNLKTTFFAAICVLARETQADYEWALAQLRGIYRRDDFRGLGLCDGPITILTDRDAALTNALQTIMPFTRHLLCTWHIGKNVETNCKSVFATAQDYHTFVNMWNLVWQSKTTENLESKWVELCAKYEPTHPAAVKYLRERVRPCEQKFAYAYTATTLHLRIKTTSQVEGAHAKMKRWLTTSMGDLKQVKDSLEKMLADQLFTFRAERETAWVRYPLPPPARTTTSISANIPRRSGCLTSLGMPHSAVL